MEDIRANIGKQIAEIRIEKGLSREELAHQIGLKELNIARIETGRSSVDIDILGKIAEALDCDISFDKRKA